MDESCLKPVSKGSEYQYEADLQCTMRAAFSFSSSALCYHNVIFIFSDCGFVTKQQETNMEFGEHLDSTPKFPEGRGKVEL